MQRPVSLLMHHSSPVFKQFKVYTIQKNSFSSTQSKKDFNISHTTNSVNSLNIVINLNTKKNKPMLFKRFQENQEQSWYLELLKQESSYPCSSTESALELLKLINDLKKVKGKQLSDYKLRTEGLSNPKKALLIITTPELKEILMSGHRKHLFFSLMIRTSPQAAKLALTNKELSSTLLENPNASEVLYKIAKDDRLKEDALPIIMTDTNLMNSILHNKQGKQLGMKRLEELEKIYIAMSNEKPILLGSLKY